MVRKQMSKQRQVNYLRQVIGPNADLIDLEALVDGSLSYKENKRIILKKLNKIINSRWTNKQYDEEYINSLREMAQSLNDSRGYKSIMKDEKLRAMNTFNLKRVSEKDFNKWMKHPERYDIEGIDVFSNSKRLKRH